MKIPKKIERSIAEHAKKWKNILTEQNPEVDRIVNELKESVKNQPKFNTKEEEIAYIIGTYTPMKILDLTLKAQWYDMIESGEKKEEYREIKTYWSKRLCCYGVSVGFCDLCRQKDCNIADRSDGNIEPRYTHVRFRYGYTKRTMLFKLNSISIGKGNPAWGAPNHEVFILKLGEKIK